MKLVTAAQMRDIDSWAINQVGVPGPVLMENAGRCVVSATAAMLGGLRGTRVAVLCGKGNNGGDGFVVARHLSNHGCRVTVYVVGGSDGIKGDALTNLQALTRVLEQAHPATGPGGALLRLVDLSSPEETAATLSRELAGFDLLIDALLGTGFSGEPREPVASAIGAINAARASGHTGRRGGRGDPRVLAVDVPSGLDSTTGQASGPCVKADVTVTFGYPKAGLVIFPGADYAGEVLVGDIGIPGGGPALGVRVETVEPAVVASWLGARKRDSHKGAYGRVLVVAGSSGMTGAAALAAGAACRAGAGLVTAGVPESLAPVMEAKLTEAMKLALPEAAEPVEEREPVETAAAGPGRVTLSRAAAGPIVEFCRDASVLAYGPGISVTAETRALTSKLLSTIEIPLVLDADALNCLGGRRDLEVRQWPTVITPHPGEMARLAGISTAEVQRDRLGVATEFARASGAVVVLKGARTVIASPDGRVFINLTGNPGMATGGMGDVLTGAIAALIAQGLPPFEAAAAGVFLHGLAGDIAADQAGEAGILAGDVLRNLPTARAITCRMDDDSCVIYHSTGTNDIYLARLDIAALVQRRYNSR
ncbi:MAG: NAD(P)H-hydrate dehydratase [Firmicutes bacterium]|nr:NAD(P)H-hydrate dehydratase [Bacillota bacterium]